MIYLASDFHLTHENCVNYCNRKPSEISDFQKLIKNDLLKIKESDTFIYLGDIDCGPKKNIEFLKLFFNDIKGFKIFLRGNHDNWISDNNLKYIGFNKISDLIIKDDILFCHYPLNGISIINYKPHYYLKNIDLTGINKIYHGHTHNTKYGEMSNDNIERINCCVDRNDGNYSGFVTLQI